MFGVNFNFLEGLHEPAPRYTSYPTIPEWDKCSDPSQTIAALQELEQREQAPLSLYFHIPFCHSMCLYCACSVVLNRNPELEKQYIQALCKEIELVSSFLGKNHRVTQIHFGGGTPTKISSDLLALLMAKISDSFNVDFSQEISIEIDPRTFFPGSSGDPLFLKSLGFNRVSLGVQDFNPQVQEAVKRRQSLEQTVAIYEAARHSGFTGINMDFIYGLPKQTAESFAKTIKTITSLKPDRIALFSFAHVPWIKPHQKAIKTTDLPSLEEKFRIYSHARHTLTKFGYVAIGMDHFALPDDDLAKSFLNKTLIRNFQGYSLPLAEDLIGFGVTATSLIGNTYTQNAKNLQDYFRAIENKQLASEKVKKLSRDDFIRKWVIHTLMCTFSLNKEEFSSRFEENFDAYFASVMPRLSGMESAGLIQNLPTELIVTPLGELFVRVIATAFDSYLMNKATRSTQTFSSSI